VANAADKVRLDPRAREKGLIYAGVVEARQRAAVQSQRPLLDGCGVTSGNGFLRLSIAAFLSLNLGLATGRVAIVVVSEQPNELRDRGACAVP
jgi:hypothetical protein